MANAHTFAMSMYSIHWNRAIGMLDTCFYAEKKAVFLAVFFSCSAQKGKRPGPVVLLAEQPSNQNKV